MVEVGFSQFFTAVIETFGIIYVAGTQLFHWLITPLEQTMGDYSNLLGDFAGLTPLEFMFGPAIILVLVLCLVRFLFPIS